MLFADWRFDADGRPQPDFVLNRPEAAGCQVLVAGPQLRLRLLARARAVGAARLRLPRGVSTSIADIFRNNALKNGLLPVRVDAAVARQAAGEPGRRGRGRPRGRHADAAGRQQASFAIEPFARYCLLNGVDELGYLLSQVPAIEAWERSQRDVHLEI